MQQPLARRAVLPLLRPSCAPLGRLAPKRNMEATEKMLVQAGEPGGLTALDFSGLRLLLALLLAGGYYFLYGDSVAYVRGAAQCASPGCGGLLSAPLWLRRRVRQRQNEITRALPDALDMMTVGVEAGSGL